MRKLVVNCFTWIFLVSLSSLVLAEKTEEEPFDIYSLSLEDLMKLKVSVASVDAERIPQTPAIVTVLDPKVLSSMGLRTLREMLAIAPGVVVQDSPLGTTAVMIRGLWENFNQKVLLLIDDVPYWMASHADIPLLGIPMEAIERVELIRGPGSVFYGTNASAGVIKVITRKAAGNRLSLSFGSHDEKNSSGYFHTNINENSELALSYEVQRTDGFDTEWQNALILPTTPPGTPVNGTTLRKVEYDSFLLNYRWGGLKVMAQHFDSTHSGASFDSTLNRTLAITYEGELLHAGYDWNFDGFDLKIYSDLNRYYFSYLIDNFFGPGISGALGDDNDAKNTKRWRTGVTGSGVINEEWSYFAGLEFERRELDEYFLKFVPTGMNLATVLNRNLAEEKSSFGQVQYEKDQWSFMLGGRYVDNSQSGTDFSPRASFIYSMDENQSFKMLYSTGFNSPNFAQKDINVPNVVQGNPDLKAELVKNFDIAYTLNTPGTLLVANSYYLKVKDLIQRQGEGRFSRFENSGNFDRYGLEADYQINQSSYRYNFGFAYQHQGNQNIADDPEAKFVPRYTVNAGIIWNLTSEHHFGSSLRYLSKRAQAGSLTLVNMSYQTHWNNLEFHADIRNLFDEEMLNPDIQDLNDSLLLQSEDNRNYQIGVRYQF